MLLLNVGHCCQMPDSYAVCHCASFGIISRVALIEYVRRYRRLKMWDILTFRLLTATDSAKTRTDALFNPSWGVSLRRICLCKSVNVWKMMQVCGLQFASICVLLQYCSYLVIIVVYIEYCLVTKLINLLQLFSLLTLRFIQSCLYHNYFTIFILLTVPHWYVNNMIW